jgi:hypothetical protein
MSTRKVIIGEGWAALASLVSAIEAHAEGDLIFWVPGSGGRVLSATPSIEGETAAASVEHMASVLGVDLGERVAGVSFLREFRNKSFREPVWNKGADIEAQRQRRQAELWKAENALLPLSEIRWSRSLVEIEEEFREKLLGHPAIQRREGIPVEGIEMVDGRAVAVIFGSGEKLEADEFVYADRWSRLAGLSGLPKPLPWNRSREPMGVLQVIFAHHEAIRPEVHEAFFTTMNRDAGETEDRHVVGHFYRDGRESIWSTVISPEEGEDNHAIAKKLRRIKQALDKMFSRTEWSTADFEKTVKNEQVRYEEAIVSGHGEAPKKPQHAGKTKHHDASLQFITDSYGAASALEQIFGSKFVAAEPMEAVEPAENDGRTPSAQAEIRV